MTVLNNHSLPSPEYTGDSDSESDIAKELEQKRRQVDEEIARYRAQKDKELKDFEAELKTKRKQNRIRRQLQRDNGINHYEFTKNSPSATPPSKSMLSAREKKARSPSRPFGIWQAEPIRLMRPNGGSKVTPPTICLDKMNIKGENIPQSHVSPLQTPPTPTNVSAFTVATVARNHDQASSARTASASRPSDQLRNKPPISPDSKVHEDIGALAGIFVPPYLPLLDTQHDTPETPIEGTQTEPASPTEPSMIEAVPVHASSLPTESSLSNNFHVPQTKRAYTSSSTIDRAKLPPIIRNVNGRKRPAGKRKHVTFQLADRAIVEPSSSYEEGPSPDIDGESMDRQESNDSIASSSSREADNQPQAEQKPPKRAPLDPFGRRKRTPKPDTTPAAEVGMSMGDLLLGPNTGRTSVPSQQPPSSEADGYFSPRNATSSPGSSSPEKSATFGSVDDNAYMTKRKEVLHTQRLERRNSRSPNVSPSSSRQTSFDSSNAAGKRGAHRPYQSPRFSPRHSPITRPLQSRYPGTLEDDLLLGHGNVGFFELDEELHSPEAGIPRPELPEDKEEELEISKGRKSKDHDLPIDLQTGTSVPIDIVRSSSGSLSNSWIGTFGH